MQHITLNIVQIYKPTTIHIENNPCEEWGVTTRFPKFSFLV
jgi:hypothetical protein